MPLEGTLEICSYGHMYVKFLKNKILLLHSVRASVYFYFDFFSVVLPFISGDTGVAPAFVKSG